MILDGVQSCLAQMPKIKPRAFPEPWVQSLRCSGTCGVIISQQPLRSQLLKQRRQLNHAWRSYAASQIARKIINTFLHRAHHIAFYMPVNSELDPLPILNQALAMKKKCYLPVLHPLKHNRLFFVAHHANDVLQHNPLGILEPIFSTKKIIASWALDLALVPLVGFDEKCHRLGMGGGFYDRTFAFKNKKPHKKPLLVGLAYETQKTSALKTNPWDVTLDLVVTEKKIYCAERRKS